MKTYNLFYELFDYKLETFGAPCNQVDNRTVDVLMDSNVVKHWFYGIQDGFTGVVIPRVIDLEESVAIQILIFLKLS